MNGVKERRDNGQRAGVARSRSAVGGDPSSLTTGFGHPSWPGNQAASYQMSAASYVRTVKAKRLDLLLQVDRVVAGVGHGWVVAGEEDEGAVVGLGLEQGEYAGAVAWVEVGGDLVGEQDARLLRERSCDGDALLLASGQLVG